jgi:hypothetical protein
MAQGGASCTEGGRRHAGSLAGLGCPDSGLGAGRGRWVVLFGGIAVLGGGVARGPC